MVVHAGGRRRGSCRAVLLCPFDNLMWDRQFVRRLFGFDHLVEVAKRGASGAFGTTCSHCSSATGSPAAPT